MHQRFIFHMDLNLASVKRCLTPQKAVLENFLDFPPPISDICLNYHFSLQLNLPFSKLNITPSARPNLEIFKNFWNWISTFKQSLLVKKAQFELNLTSFKWASARLGSSNDENFVVLRGTNKFDGN